MHDKIGYIKLYRSISENEIYQLPPLYLRVFERLILEANHQDNEIPYRKNGEVTTKIIKRGEKLTSIRQISEWVGWYERGIFKKPNPKLIKEILDYLTSNNMIFIYDESNRKETHYKVVNYEIYQCKDEIKVTEKKQPSNAQVTEKKQLALQNKNDKECKEDIYKDVIDYLNLKVESNYKYTTKKTRDLIKARLNDGFKLEDFKRVIDNKVIDWKGKVSIDGQGNKFDGNKFLRPETLFGNKFEGYLNEKHESKLNSDIKKQNIKLPLGIREIPPNPVRRDDY